MPAGTQETKQHKVLLVDDHPVVRHGLADLISDDPTLDVCAQADDGGEAMRLIESHQPDIVLIDITLRDANGLELIKQVKSRFPGVKMLVTSMHDEKIYAERSLRAGAMGYLNKQEAVTSVLTAIHQVLGGTVFVSQQLADRMLQRVVGGGEPVTRSPLEALSDRELEVFSLIGTGLTTRQIAEKLRLSPKTVETHRDHIKTKLRFSNNNELVRFAVEWTLQGT